MAQRKTVVQVCFSSSWGGLEMSAVKWTRLFHEANYNSICACTEGSPIAEECQRLGLATLAIKKPQDYISWTAKRELKKLIKNERPTALFSHFTKDLWHLSPVLKGEESTQLFSFARMFIKGVNKKDWAHRRIYSQLDKMIALSHIQKKHLMDCLPLNEDQYIVIPNGVRTDQFFPQEAKPEIRRQLGASDPNQILIGLIGRLDPLKGHMEFVEAAQKVLQTHPDARFAMVGSATAFHGDEFSQKILTSIEKFGLENHITLTSHRTDIPDVLNALDIFCMPSYEENFGNVILEAMACGKACIGTHSGGTPEIIEDRETGLLIEPQSGESLSQALKTLIEDSDLRETLAKNALEKARKVYDLRRVFEQIEALL